MIDQELVKRIKDTAKIEDVIGEYIGLKRAGVNYKANCPFHDEKTDSLIVSPAKGIFKCFGCGKGGDAVHFVQEFEKVSFRQAIKTVARRYRIDVPERDFSPDELSTHKHREKTLTLLSEQNNSFRKALKEHETALSYLENRGISFETIDKWNLGWATQGFFGGRITYPIHNDMGEICGFTGRTLQPDIQPKYKNSAEDEYFKKSELLYGLCLAKRHISKMDKCYVVEGQHDVLQMVQMGFGNTVAPSGTSLTKQHIQLIKRFSKNIVLLLDADAPGIKAVIKNISPLLAEQINLRIILLPKGEDPDSFIRKSEPDKAIDYINSMELDFIQFKAHQFKIEIETNPSKKGELITSITQDIGLVHDKNVRFAYIQECSKIFGVRENELTSDIQKLREKIKVNNEEGHLFAFDEAASVIEEMKNVNIISDFDDVIDFHLNNKGNYVGMNCAPLQQSEILKLKKLTKTVTFDENIEDAFDLLTKEETPMVKNLKRLVSYGFDVIVRVPNDEIIPKRKNSITINDEVADIKVGEKQFDLENEVEINDANEFKYNNFTDWYMLRVMALLSIADDKFTNSAIDHIAELLSYLPENLRITKIHNFRDAFGVRGFKLTLPDIKKRVENYLKKNAKPFNADNEYFEYSGDNPTNLNQEQPKIQLVNANFTVK